MARSFLLGATAGRTTLNGEGLQHEDGHSLLLAATNPAVVTYDPAFSFEVAHITRDALVRMYGDDPGAPLGGHRSPDVMYYLTVYNEPFNQPAEPENLDLQGLLAGMYRYAEGPQIENGKKAQILASGVSVPWALRAQELLAQDWGVSADVWSVTSWTELRRDAVEAEEHNLLHPEDEPTVPYVTRRLQEAEGPVVAVSDFMRAVPDLIAPYAPHGMKSLAPTGSVSPTPARRCAGTSTSTPSRSSSGRSPRSPTGAGSTGTSSGRRWRSTRSATCRPPRPRSARTRVPRPDARPRRRRDGRRRRGHRADLRAGTGPRRAPGAGGHRRPGRADDVGGGRRGVVPLPGVPGRRRAPVGRRLAGGLRPARRRPGERRRAAARHDRRPRAGTRPGGGARRSGAPPRHPPR